MPRFSTKHELERISGLDKLANRILFAAQGAYVRQAADLHVLGHAHDVRFRSLSSGSVTDVTGHNARMNSAAD